MRRILLGLLAGVVLAFVAPAAAQAASVRVIDENGKEHAVDLAQLSGQEDSPDGSGFTLLKVIQAAGANSVSFNYLTVSRPGQSNVQITKDQVRDSIPFVTDGGGSVGFTWVSSEDGASYAFNVPGELTLNLYAESPIEISLDASETEIDPEGTVDFTAAITHPANLQPDIRWNFGDGSGTDADEEEVSHKFWKEGEFDVVVTATDPDTGVGPSATVRIQVGEKKERKKDPDRKGGGKNKDEDAPDSGTSDGGYTPTPGAPAPVAPVVPASPAPVPTPTPPNPDPPKPDKPEPDPILGEQVSGELLQEATIVPPPEPQQDEETKPPAARTGSERGDGFGIPGAALGGVSVIALLGLGALGQAGRIRPDSMLWHANRLIGR